MLVIIGAMVLGAMAVVAPARSGVGVVQTGERFLKEALAAGEQVSANQRYVSALSGQWLYLTTEETGVLHRTLTLASTTEGEEKEQYTKEFMGLFDKGVKAFAKWQEEQGQ